MKFIVFLSALCCCSWLCAQTKTEKRLMDSIEKQVLQPTVKKAEHHEPAGWNGAYTNMTVYYKKRRPVLIVKEEKQVIDAELTDGSHEVATTVFLAKFYIQNWRNNKYIRVGAIENTTVHYSDKNSDPVKNMVVMPANFAFTYKREEVKRLMEKKAG